MRSDGVGRAVAGGVAAGFAGTGPHPPPFAHESGPRRTAVAGWPLPGYAGGVGRPVPLLPLVRQRRDENLHRRSLRKRHSTCWLPVQPHFLALQFRLPPLLHAYDVLSRRGRPRHFQDRHVIVAGFSALEAEVPTVTGLHIVLPA